MASTAPLETHRVRDDLLLGRNAACLSEEGVAGFWRGNLANMQRIIPQARAREPRARARPPRHDLF
mgnify:CR=1 FL=1